MRYRHWNLEKNNFYRKLGWLIRNSDRVDP